MREDIEFILFDLKINTLHDAWQQKRLFSVHEGRAGLGRLRA
jgi:hypothetical protein